MYGNVVFTTSEADSSDVKVNKMNSDSNPEDFEKNDMYLIMEEFVENQDSFNALLLPMQTGSGKTYTCVRYMERFVKRIESGNGQSKGGYPKRIVYTTPLKNNLPKKLLRQYLGDDLYDRYVMEVKPLADEVINGWPSITSEDLMAMRGLDLSKQKEYETLCTSISDANYKLKEYSVKKKQLVELKKNPEELSLINELMKNIRANRDRDMAEFKDVERAYRKQLHANIRKYREENNLSDEDLLKLSDYAWIEKLYPSVHTSEKLVFLMTMAKFDRYHDPIISPSFRVDDSDFLKDSLVIMDEFDATKQTIEDSLFPDNSDYNGVEPIEMFRAIHKSLNSADREHLVRIYDYTGSEDKKDKLRASLSSITDLANTLYLKFGLGFRTSNESEDIPFILHDFRSVTLSRGKVCLRKVSEEQKNVIEFIRDGNVTEDMTPVDVVLTSLNTFFRGFAGFIREMAQNYVRKMDIAGHVISMDFAVDIVLDVFELERQYDNNIKSLITMGNRGNSTKPKIKDLSFYNLGFRYCEMERSTEHRETVKLHQTSYTRTPESVLMNMMRCSGIKLIGISATAELKTVIKNYDSDYLGAKDSPMRFMRLGPSEIKRLNGVYQTSTKNHSGNVEVIVKKIDLDDYPFENICVNQFSADDLESLIHNASMLGGSNEKNKAYIAKRYHRFAAIYKEFLYNKDIKSELALFNIQVKDGDYAFDRAILIKIANILLNEYNDDCGDLIEVPFMTLRGQEEYAADSEAIFRRLESGKKVLVLSTYQTVGSGQNLQYKIPAGSNVVKINDFEASEEKDFDAIYLDELTNIVPKVRTKDYKARDQRCFAIEELVETGELTMDDARDQIRGTFNECLGNSTHPASIMDLDSYMLAKARAIIQGIGRMTRTNMRNPKEYIYFDKEVAKNFIKDIECYGRLRSIEFEKFYYAAQEINAKEKRTKEKMKEFRDRASLNASKQIQSYVSDFNRYNGVTNDLKDASIESYERLGQFVLRCPTSESNEDGGQLESIGVKGIFTRLPEVSNEMRYFVNETDKENSYSNITVSAKGDCIVSESDCRLDVIREIPGFRRYMEDNGLATVFRPGRYIMSPALYNRIYKGRLGEAAGRWILENKIGLKMIPLPREYYEMFDEMIESGAYIDYKNWSGSIDKDQQEWEVNNAFRKLEEVGGIRAYIVNIIKPEEGTYDPVYTVKRGNMTLYMIGWLYDRALHLNEDASNLLKSEIGVRKQ